MKLRQALLPFLICLLPLSMPAAKPEYSSSRTLLLETRTFIRLLEEAHYNRDAVTIDSYSEIIQDYMAAIDGQRLFFTQIEKDQYNKRFTPNFIYWNLSALGHIDTAYTIFSNYKKLVDKRVAWINKYLEEEIDLNTDETYVIDRSKAEWAANQDESDDLWRSRIKFELVKELLNKKEMTEAKEAVRKRYKGLQKNLADTESNDIAEIFLSTIARLYDPHSTYFSPETLEDFSINISLKLVGIGALLSMEDDQCVIKEIIPGGPADLDKRLKPNDKITAVAQGKGEPVEVIGMKLRKVVRMIRGEKGTPVRLTIEPAANPSSPREIELIRDVVNLDSSRATGAVFQVPDNKGNTLPIGVISLPSFYGASGASDGDSPQSTTSEDVAALIAKLKDENIQALVLDLRRNGGGLLAEAISLAGLFIKKGPVVQIRNQIGQVKVESDTDPSIAYEGPLVILTSRWSASASEIVAGTLQNYGRAIVVGDSSTHGKGTVQTVYEIKNIVPQLLAANEKIGAAKFTIQKFYLANGASTQLRGVIPDIILPSSNEYIPIGESDLPHALPWDEIPSSKFDATPFSSETLAALKESSQKRVDSLPEFDLLKRRIAIFKDFQEKKAFSVNLEKRKQEKAEDLARNNAFNIERKKLAEEDYAFTEIFLAPPPPKRITADDEEEEEEGDNYKELFADENERHPYLDIPLKESLRVIIDLLAAEKGSLASTNQD